MEQEHTFNCENVCLYFTSQHAIELSETSSSTQCDETSASYADGPSISVRRDSIAESKLPLVASTEISQSEEPTVDTKWRTFCL